MKLKTFLAAITLLLFCFVNGQAQVTVIKAGKLVDPATATTLTNQVILVEGGKIKAVGAGLQTETVKLFSTQNSLCSSFYFLNIFQTPAGFGSRFPNGV